MMADFLVTKLRGSVAFPLAAASAGPHDTHLSPPGSELPPFDREGIRRDSSPARVPNP